MKFATEALDESSIKKRCIVRRADDDSFDKAMHLWFTQESIRAHLSAVSW